MKVTLDDRTNSRNHGAGCSRAAKPRASAPPSQAIGNTLQATTLWVAISALLIATVFTIIVLAPDLQRPPARVRSAPLVQIVAGDVREAAAQTQSLTARVKLNLEGEAPVPAPDRLDRSPFNPEASTAGQQNPAAE